MRVGLLGFVVGIFLAGSSVVPAKATIVYVTYSGTITSGTDPGGVFGKGENLNGKPYEVLYVFDTGGYADNHPTENFVFGGTAFGVPSPLIGTAVLTVGGYRDRGKFSRRNSGH